jgi:hypothetical protein
VRILLGNGADKGKRNLANKNAFKYAVQKNFTEIMEMPADEK